MILTYDVGGDYFRTYLPGAPLPGREQLLLLGHGHRNVVLNPSAT